MRGKTVKSNMSIHIDTLNSKRGSTKGENMETVKNENSMYNFHEFKSINSRLPSDPYGGNA